MFLNFLRMWQWAVFTVVLFCLAFLSQKYVPGSMLAVSLYKAHLLALGGWGGYWLDRACSRMTGPTNTGKPKPKRCCSSDPTKAAPRPPWQSPPSATATQCCAGQSSSRRP